MRQKIVSVILFLVYGAFSGVAFAQETSKNLTLRPISFYIADKIYSSQEEIDLTFALNNCSHDFRIRPTVDIGIIEIFNPKTLTWVSQNNSWESFPYVDGKMKIRSTNVSDKKVLLGLELQNIKLGTVTKSKGMRLWISNAYKSYIDLLNTSIIPET